MKLIYLAQPYTHPDFDVRRERFIQAKYWTARLMARNAVFSPIVHGHTVEPHIGHVHEPHRFWMDQCIPILRKCDIMIVLALPGWRESKGLRDEFQLCQYANIPVRFLCPQALSELESLELPSVEEASAHGWEFHYV